MAAETFRVRDGALDDFIGWCAEAAGFDISNGLETAGFVPTLRNLLDAVGSGWNLEPSSSHRRPMATQIAWVVYLFAVPRLGLGRPMASPLNRSSRKL